VAAAAVANLLFLIVAGQILLEVSIGVVVATVVLAVALTVSAFRALYHLLATDPHCFAGEAVYHAPPSESSVLGTESPARRSREDLQR
jgi:hypothetical protein